ncbi:hypothetical protein JAAARDRAFT_256694 [Jaapia argillacea MUCL 33604]|uniref:Uncharacterized protein n=1 Tax=Jaapia argillacea MUCL 33604 TaxID=933084 RepID=A0A067PTP0_9AGAM|nr:hypothetical protein JAAARDRAFT_256694 [Jaapia argillacea MUCL 33604]
MQEVHACVPKETSDTVASPFVWLDVRRTMGSGAGIDLNMTEMALVFGNSMDHSRLCVFDAENSCLASQRQAPDTGIARDGRRKTG